MMPKVGQLLRWYDNPVLNLDGQYNDVGIVTEVRTDEIEWDHQQYDVIINWCKGPHHSLHDQEEWEESIRTNEIVVV